MPAMQPNPLLPEFGRPPLVEVALSVQFEPIAGLHTPQIGLLWQEYRDRFPKTEEHPPLEPVFELFEIGPKPRGKARFEILSTPPVPRCWFLTAEGSGLIQVQNDRFVHNWRRVSDEAAYPRYDAVRSVFERELGSFKALIENHASGEFHPNQVEVTYVNHIVAGEGWRTHADLGDVVTLFSPRGTDAFAPELEDCGLTARYVMRNESGEPIGRLHVAVEPSYRAEDDTPMFVLTLTVRGRPLEESIEGVMQFLELGRDWIVRMFATITTPEMHALWERLQ